MEINSKSSKWPLNKFFILILLQLGDVVLCTYNATNSPSFIKKSFIYLAEEYSVRGCK